MKEESKTGVQAAYYMRLLVKETFFSVSWNNHLEIKMIFLYLPWWLNSLIMYFLSHVQLFILTLFAKNCKLFLNATYEILVITVNSDSMFVILLFCLFVYCQEGGWWSWDYFIPLSISSAWPWPMIFLNLLEVLPLCTYLLFPCWPDSLKIQYPLQKGCHWTSSDVGCQAC